MGIKWYLVVVLNSIFYIVHLSTVLVVSHCITNHCFHSSAHWVSSDVWSSHVWVRTQRLAWVGPLRGHLPWLAIEAGGWLRAQLGLSAWCCPNFLAPWTGFVEDSVSSTEGCGGHGSRMIRARHIYCTLYL